MRLWKRYDTTVDVCCGDMHVWEAWCHMGINENYEQINGKCFNNFDHRKWAFTLKSRGTGQIDLVLTGHLVLNYTDSWISDVSLGQVVVADHLCINCISFPHLLVNWQSHRCSPNVDMPSERGSHARVLLPVGYRANKLCPLPICWTLPLLLSSRAGRWTCHSRACVLLLGIFINGHRNPTLQSLF